ncbi:glycosyl transferase [Amycolatopsis antarctica]|uniref:Glycosyl transferase n=1 Tax=Amycolatopsis antarctica TaxID=1854586 RepID=A0A263D0Z7_9PSEU|nr:nucleotide disphospho-sugar-binding domain-containing protein [Amycolatopsis antarctica]OZM71889.1 glycosyl transferase [Amycolatopsis antarctica]
MRVLFTVFPAPAHFLPLVPYAWALQAAGHEVCVAAPAGIGTGIADPDFQRSVRAAGLSGVSCGEPELLAVHDRGYPEFESLLPTAAETGVFSRALGFGRDELATWEMFHCFQVLAARDFHPPKPRQDIDALIDFARRWRPDLVVWDPWLPSGAVAARACGAAHARALNAPDYSGWVHERLAAAPADVLAALPEDPLTRTVRPLAERYGLDVDTELLLGQWTIDPFPADLRLTGGLPTVDVRYVPYNGSGEIPEWLHGTPDIPRVAVSLGVSARNFLTGDWGRTATLIEAVADLDIEVVATLNANQLMDVEGALPPNVRAVDYIPLTQLLPTCSALIHHGSIGTFGAASAMGVPQLVCDTDEAVHCYGTVRGDGIDWNFDCQKQVTATETSRMVVRRGAGVRLDHQTQPVKHIREQIVRVLGEPSFREGAAAIRREWAATPSPADIVGELETLTELHRDRHR